MALKEATEKLRQTVDKVLGDAHETRDTLRETVKDIRPKPVRSFIRRKTGSLLKRSRQEAE